MPTKTRLAPGSVVGEYLGVPLMIGMALSVVMLTAAAYALAAAQATVEITIDGYSFTPATTTIEPGTLVEWINRDDSPHTIVAQSLAFRSKALDTNDRFSHRFVEPGVIDYFCSLHPHMMGKVIVRSHGG